MEIFLVSFALMVLGGVIYWLGRRRRPSVNVKVTATKNSVAIGGANSGSVTNTQTNEAAGHGILTIVAIVVELVAIGLALFQIFHRAG